ncbi:glucose-1-phosphate adenylyltransferase [bacterium]|nr:glucose-1-phosphate adenylyltransferase [bacterium]
MNKVLTIIMAGGEGTRLSVLANRRAKPAVPFGGIYRIIDFTLSNVMHSGARWVGVVTQYRPYSLADHLGLGESWGFSRMGRKLRVLAPHTGEKDSAFYSNTADAVYRNVEFIKRFPECTEVLVLSGDHIYKMDYRPMLEVHRANRSRLTIATQEVPWEETSRFGLMVCDSKDRVIRFQEKPKKNPLSNKASLGIYIFDLPSLIEALQEDQADPDSQHDFGGDIIPRLIDRGEPVYNYSFNGYWRDVGTIPAYMETSMEALDPTSPLDLESWGLRTNVEQIPLNKQHPSHIAAGGSVKRSLVSRGVTIEGDVRESILSPGVRIGRGARVRRAILLHDVVIEDGAVVEDAIIDKHCRIGRGSHVGCPELGDRPNDIRPDLLSNGTVVIGKGAEIEPETRIGRNSLIFPYVETISVGRIVPAGTTCFGDMAAHVAKPQ